MSKGFLWLLPFLTLAVAACASVQTSPTCDQLALPSLRALMQDEIPGEQVATQIGMALQMPPEAISLHKVEALSTSAPWLNTEIEVGDVSATWGIGDVRYGATLRDRRIIKLGVAHGANPPSLAQVIQCLGSPEGYWARSYVGPQPTTRRLAQLYLYYESLGVLATASRYGYGAQSASFDGHDPVVGFAFVPPIPADSVMGRLTSSWDPTERAKFKLGLKPWPEEWKDIFVESADVR
jgi:hypothetical protein